MTTVAEQMRLEAELTGFQHTMETLTLRLEHTLIALALTCDAQAATRRRLNGDSRGHDYQTADELQSAAERYRRLARDLPGRPV